MKNLLWVLGLWWLASCSKANTTTMRSKTIATPIYTYLALGDSYTIGERVTTEDRFPIQLQERLKVDDIHCQTTIIAQTGWTTGNLIDKLNQVDLKDTFDVLTLLIGVNNLYRHNSLITYEQELDTLLERSIRLVGGEPQKVLVASIPDYGYTPVGISDQAAISRATDKFNTVKKRLTLQKGAIWIDITPISRQAMAEPNLLAADGLHPSGRMYRKWVDKLYPLAKNILE